MKTVTITISLTETAIADLKEVLGHMRDRDITTIEQVAVKMLEAGTASSLYRYERNAQKWLQQKADRALLAELLAEKKKRELTDKE